MRSAGRKGGGGHVAHAPFTIGVGLVVAADWLVFSPERPIDEVQESLLGIVRRVART